VKRRKSPTSATTVTAYDESDPAQRLKRCGDGRHRPLWHQLFDLTRQPVASEFGVLDGMDIILQHDLLRRMIEAYRVNQRRYASVQARAPR
jgi:hypothetical protein